MPAKTSRAVRFARALFVVTLAVAAAPASAAAAPCPEPPTTQPFASVGDANHYFLAPGGDFEGDLEWQTTGSARQAWGHEPLAIAGSTALVLPPGASATSPEVCVSALHPHLRFGARAGGGVLRVEALAPDGEAVTLARLSAGSYAEWTLTPPVALAGTLGLSGEDARFVRLRLVAEEGRWLADGIYVDPFRR